MAQIGRGKSGQAGGDPLWVLTGPPGLLEDRPSGPVANPGLPLGFCYSCRKYLTTFEWLVILTKFKRYTKGYV